MHTAQPITCALQEVRKAFVKLRKGLRASNATPGKLSKTRRQARDKKKAHILHVVSDAVSELEFPEALTEAVGATLQ